MKFIYCTKKVWLAVQTTAYGNALFVKEDELVKEKQQDALADSSYLEEGNAVKSTDEAAGLVAEMLKEEAQWQLKDVKENPDKYSKEELAVLPLVGLSIG